MANETEKIAMKLCEKVAEEQGVYVVDVDYSKTNDGYSLCFYIDKDGGVGIDDCERFSKAVEVILDKEDPVPNEYVLEVSSPGAERQLKTEREFNYYIGRKVDVKLYKAVDGIKELSGVLTDFRDKKAYIDSDGKMLEINPKDAAYIKLTFEI